MVRRHVSTVLILSLSALLLTQFQNCGSTNMVASSVSPSGEVRIIDDFNKAEIQFISSQIQIQDEVDKTDLSGFCNRSRTGSQLRWAVWPDAERSGQPIAAGLADCRSGQFVIPLEGLSQMVCGLDHVVMVEGDWGGVAVANFNRRCQALASEQVQPPVDSPVGTSCSLELQPNEGAQGSPCTQVCYRDDKVISILPVNQVLCSGLAAKLAGP